MLLMPYSCYLRALSASVSGTQPCLQVASLCEFAMQLLLQLTLLHVSSCLPFALTSCGSTSSAEVFARVALDLIQSASVAVVLCLKRVHFEFSRRSTCRACCRVLRQQFSRGGDSSLKELCCIEWQLDGKESLLHPLRAVFPLKHFVGKHSLCSRWKRTWCW